MSDDINAALGIASSEHKAMASGAQSPSEFLAAIRLKTSYGSLRAFITLFSVISIILILISAIFCVVKGATDSNGLFILLGIAGGILSVFVVIASQQASSLLIDIADTLIEQNRRKPSS